MSSTVSEYSVKQSPKKSEEKSLFGKVWSMLFGGWQTEATEPPKEKPKRI